MFHAPRDAGAPAEQPAPFSAMRVVFVVCSVAIVACFLTVWTVASVHAGWKVASVDAATGGAFIGLLGALLGAKCYQCKCE